MARVKMEITCTICGNSFTHIHNCYNRTDADSYEKWAADNITICPKCYAKAKAEEAQSAAEALIEELGIAKDIEGVSDKQIAYAHKRRNEFIASHETSLRKVASALAYFHANREETTRRALEKGFAESELPKSMFIARGYSAEYTILTSNSARDILDAI